MTPADTTRAPSGRRSAPSVGRRRLDITAVLAVLLPLLTVGALVLVQPDDLESQGSRADAPVETDLTKAVVICPSGEPLAFVASETDASGEVDVEIGPDKSTATLTPGEVTEVSGGTGPLVVTGAGALAPGLVAGRFGTPPAAAECRAPAPDQWFTGAGAGAKHRSVLELVNPDAGRAVVDTLVYGRRGIVDVPELRGVAVPGKSAVRIDLARTIPRRDNLTLRVSTNRGRIGASLRDTVDELGAGAEATDWLPSQEAPATSNLMLGLPAGTGRRTLLLANAGEAEARAQVRIVTEDSVFSPEGAEDVVVGPESTRRVSLEGFLQGADIDDAIGLLVESTAPVTTSVRSFVDGDVSHAVPAQPVAERTTQIVAPGEKQLLLGGADRTGTVTVTATDADGQQVTDERVEVVADRGAVVSLPPSAALVTVTPRNTSIAGSVLSTDDDGVAVVRLRTLLRTGLIADVRPGLP